MKIGTLHDSGARIVKRYRKGRCFAAVWSSDTTDKQVMSQMHQGEGDFFPYDESTGKFLWGQATRAIHFKR